MASPVHQFQTTQGFDANAPPQNYDNPAVYSGGPPPGYSAGGVAPGYAFSAPNALGYAGAPPTGYAYGGAPNAPGYAGGPPPGYAYGALPGAGGCPSYLPPNSTPSDCQGSVPPSNGGYPNGTVPAMQVCTYGAPNATGYIPNAGASAPGYPPVCGGGAPSYAYGTPNPNGAQGYPSYPVGGVLMYPPGGTSVHPINAAGYGYDVKSAQYPPSMVQGAGYPAAAGTVGAVVGYPPASQMPAAQVSPHDQIETGRWAAGLCSCCNFCMPNCLMPCCCPFVSLAQIYARLGVLSYKVALVLFFVLYIIGLVGFVTPNKTSYAYNYNTRSYEVVKTSSGGVIPTVIITVGEVIFCLYVWRARASIRERFRIPGNCCTDCLASCCCSCCTIAQMATHVKSYTPGDCSFEGPDVLPPYAR